MSNFPWIMFELKYFLPQYKVCCSPIHIRAYHHYWSRLQVCPLTKQTLCPASSLRLASSSTAAPLLVIQVSRSKVFQSVEVAHYKMNWLLQQGRIYSTLLKSTGSRDLQMNPASAQCMFFQRFVSCQTVNFGYNFCFASKIPLWSRAGLVPNSFRNQAWFLPATIYA